MSDDGARIRELEERFADFSAALGRERAERERARRANGTAKRLSQRWCIHGAAFALGAGIDEVPDYQATLGKGRQYAFDIPIGSYNAGLNSDDTKKTTEGLSIGPGGAIGDHNIPTYTKEFTLQDVPLVKAYEEMKRGMDPSNYVPGNALPDGTVHEAPSPEPMPAPVVSEVDPSSVLPPEALTCHE